jgi:hypothetical protein
MLYSTYRFKTRGVGIISNTQIIKDTYIGNCGSKFETITKESRIIYDGWIETNPLGRYINHNRASNCKVILDGDFIKLYSITNIDMWEELTINYSDMGNLLKIPETLRKKIGNRDFDYIPEVIKVETKLI